MARVLVTGGAGFIGAAVVRALAARGDEVYAFDLPGVRGHHVLAERHPGVSALSGELTEWPSVAHALRRARPDAVVHCAALVGAPASAEAPYATLRVNVEGSLHLLEAMRLLGVPRMVHMSTEEVYGHFQADVIDETHPCNPLMPYGISKYAFEQLARSFAGRYGVEVVHVRTCWVYGRGLPRPRAPKIFLDAALAGRALHLPAGGDMRVDHVHVDDTVQGILLALDRTEHAFDVYHVATGVAPSLAEIVDIVRDLVPAADISIGPGNYSFNDQVEAVRKGALDVTRARSELGYAPRYDIRSGLEAYLEASRAGTG
jgi:nucleoside-diphosphate-sugar epimerase